MDEQTRKELNAAMEACLEGVQALDEAHKLIDELREYIDCLNTSANITITTLVQMAGGRVEINEDAMQAALQYELVADKTEKRVVYSLQRLQTAH